MARQARAAMAAGAEIEITDAMVDAGFAVLRPLLLSGAIWDDPQEALRDAFCEMLRTAPAGALRSAS